MTTKQRVANILAVSHEARCSDKALLIIFMQKAGMNLTPSQIQIFRKLNTESIRRQRQILQHDEGKYPADENVDKARYDRFKEIRGNSGSVEKVLEKDNIFKDYPYDN
jgi:hypothetical protein